MFQPLLLWESKTIEGTNTITSIAQLIAKIKEKTAIVIWGVIRGKNISPFEDSKMINTSTISESKVARHPQGST